MRLRGTQTPRQGGIASHSQVRGYFSSRPARFEEREALARGKSPRSRLGHQASLQWEAPSPPLTAAEARLMRGRIELILDSRNWEWSPFFSLLIDRLILMEDAAHAHE